ncbi:hypothetical protein AgCh_031178 [Apium graveolens]
MSRISKDGRFLNIKAGGFSRFRIEFLDSGYPKVIEMSEVCVAFDIWSVGCTLSELLACSPPYYDLQPMPALFRIGIKFKSAKKRKSMLIGIVSFGTAEQVKSAVQNTADLSDLVLEEIENQKKWHLLKNVKSRVQLSKQKVLQSSIYILVFLYIYLAKSYSLAGKRAETYSLYRRGYRRACSLADTTLKRLQSPTTADQVHTPKELHFMLSCVHALHVLPRSDNKVF